MVAHDDDVFRALVSDDPTWEDADAADVHVEDDSAAALPGDARASETDPMLAQYFGEVRRFALLSFAEEQALGRRITRWQRRVRWALYTSPMALPTLRRIWLRLSLRTSPCTRSAAPRGDHAGADRTMGAIQAGHPVPAGSGHTAGLSGNA